MNSDVLSHVFKTVIDDDPSSLPAIRAVNREWFETADNTPRLWSKFDLHRKIHFTDPAYARLHIQNAGGIPLDITITLPDDVSYKDNIPVISELRNAVNKIKSLVIDVPFHEAWQVFVSGIGEGQAAPLLERLVLKVKDDVDDVANNGPYTTLSTALTPSPKLTDLQLPAWPLLAHPPPQLSTVTTLTFDTPFTGLDIPALFPIIQAATHLEHFKFKADDMGAEIDPYFSNPISVPHLRTVDVTTPGYGLAFLRSVRAPLLTHIRLDGYREIVPDEGWELDDWGVDISRPASEILAHLSIHAPNICSLELKYVPFEHPHDDWSRILDGRAFPLLEKLTLERSNIPDSALIASAGKYPNIKELRFLNCKYISSHGVRRFIEGLEHNDFGLMVEGCPAISQEEIGSLSKIVRVIST